METGLLLKTLGLFYKSGTSLSIVLLGIFILVNNPKGRLNRAVFALGMYAGLSSCFSSLLDAWALLFDKVSWVAVYGYPLFGAFIPSGLIVFHLLYPRPFKWVKRWHLILIYLPSLFFVYLSVSLEYIHNIQSINHKPVMEYTFYYVVYSIYQMFSFVICFLCLIVKKKEISNERDKTNLKYLFKFEIIVALILAVGYLMPYYASDMYLYETGLLSFFLMIGYSIVKYQAFDIRTAVHYTAVWIILLIIAMAPVAILPFIFPNIAGNSEGVGREIALGVYGVLSIAYFYFVTAYINPVVRKALLRRNKKLQNLVNSFRDEIENAGDFKSFVQIIDKRMKEYLFAEKVFVQVKNNENDQPLLDDRDQQWLITCEQITNRKKIIDYVPQDSFLKKEVHLAIKIEYSGENIGTILLGEKRNLKIYDYNDIGFIKEILTSLSATLHRLQIAKKATELEVISRLKETLFINLAHETKTPLAIIKANLDKYLKTNEQNKEILEIKQNIDRLLRDMINFLDADKIEQGKILYTQNRNIDLSEFARKKATAFNALALKAGILIRCELEAKIIVKADPFAIDRVFNNLIDNAIKYNQANGEIGICLKKEGEKAVLKISDTGIGMSEDDIKKIFQPYYQVAHKKKNLQGIGMGLYITKGIVESLQGTIKVMSEPGKGSTFIITFGLSEQKGALDQNIEVSTPIIRIISEMPDDFIAEDGRPYILLVEDNLSLLKVIKDELVEQYSVICAANGVQALKKINLLRTCPDLIISDIMMDKMDGYELREKIISNPKLQHIPFIFLTSKTTLDDSIKGLTSGAIDYIFKPFPMKVLKAKIKAVIDYVKLKQSIFENERYRTIGMMTASISHEIMNPLAGIKGPLYVLENSVKKFLKGAGDEVFLSINHIKENVERINTIVSTLRSLMSGESLTIEMIDAKKLLEGIIKVFDDKLRARISFELFIEENLNISTNRSALTQILMNLICNAVDSITAPEGKITVSGRKERGGQVLVVADNGTGIESSNLKKVFDLAFTTKKDGKGTGLGLFIVKELSEKLNIKIEIASELNKGTKVQLVFEE